MEKRDGEKNGSGEKEYEGWKRVEEGTKEGERQEADHDRAEEFPGEKGRVEVEKGENDKEQRGGRR